MSAKSTQVAAFVAGVLALGICHGQLAADGDRPDLPAAEKQIFSETNAFRRQEGRGELKVNAELSKAAHYFAKFMAETDKYGHTADGKEPWDRAKKYGYDYCLIEENIAYQFDLRGFTTRRLAEGFVEGWKHSPGHRKNMLNADVGEIGVAVAHSPQSGKFYAVQMFGRPKSAAIQFSVANRSDTAVTYKVDEESFTLEPRFTRTHEACTVPKVTFSTPEESGTRLEGTHEFRPSAGTQFVVRREGAGRLTVQAERREASTKR